MSEQPATDTEVPAEPSGEGGTEARLDSLESKLTEVLDFLRGSNARPAQPEPERDIKAEAREAVREVQAAEKKRTAAEQERQSLADEVAHLKAVVETPPEEYRKVTQAMGWNRP